MSSSSSSNFLLQGKLRLDAFLTALVPETSRGKIQATIKAGNVTVNGKRQKKAGVKVQTGDDAVLSPSSEASLFQQHLVCLATCGEEWLL